MAKKSAAQLRRLKARAEKRGEEFIPPVETKEDNNSPENESKAPEPKKNETKKKTKKPSDSSSEKNEESTKDSKLIAVAIKLKKELTEIQSNETLRAKERRSHKRKAEAIAAEEAGISAEEMQKWFEENQEMLEKLEQQNSSKNKKESESNEEGQNHKIPYIVFVGQLSFDTSKEALFQHIKSELGSEFKSLTHETVKIRLLTDPKTKKSRGMAFVELDSPELMYACLSLHHTLLDGRRLNVERSAGGRKKENRNAKIKQFRDQQEEYLSKVVDSIIGEFIKTGELKEGELDEGAIAMCKRYSAGMVETAIKEYIESNGSTMDNTSAYFSFLLGKLATEKAEEGPQTGSKGKDDGKKGADSKAFSSSKRQKISGSSIQEKNRTKKEKTSTIASQSALPQVDFTISEKGNSKQPAMSEMFPSLARRGRGRGYM